MLVIHRIAVVVKTNDVRTYTKKQTLTYIKNANCELWYCSYFCILSVGFQAYVTMLVQYINIVSRSVSKMLRCQILDCRQYDLDYDVLEVMYTYI